MTMERFKRYLQGEPTLEELQDREERRTVELSIKEKEALIAELEYRGKRWQEFSRNGQKSGISWEKVKAFIKGSPKGGK